MNIADVNSIQDLYLIVLQEKREQVDITVDINLLKSLLTDSVKLGLIAVDDSDDMQKDDRSASIIMFLKQSKTNLKTSEVLATYGEMTSFKIGKKNPLKDKNAIKLPYDAAVNGGIMSSTTTRNLETLRTSYDIKFDYIYVALTYDANMAPTFKAMLSYFATGVASNGNKVLFARRETGTPGAGQTYLFVGDKQFNASDFIPQSFYPNGDKERTLTNARTAGLI